MDAIEAIKAKADALMELQSDLVECIKKMTEMALLPNSPYGKVNRRRMFKLIGLAMNARVIKMQMDIVNAQPIKPIKGGETLTILNDKI